jgi:hypothetical protein
MAVTPHEELRFRETHRLPGWLLTAVIFVSVSTLLLVVMLKTGGRATGANAWAGLGLLVLGEIGVVVFLLRLRFTFAVTSRALYVRVTPWVFNRRIPLEQVASAEAVSMPWMIGVKWSPRVWRISPGTARGVRVQLPRGRSLLIGVEEPEAMVAAMARHGPAPAGAARA